MNPSLSALALLLASSLCPVARTGDPISVLIVDGRNNHNWKATTPVLRAILRNTGRFAVDVATVPKDMAEFAPDFSRYAVVLSNYNGPPWPEKTKTAFVDFVKRGGGLVIVHAADNSFPKWREYNEMIGLGGWGRRTEKDGPYIRLRDGKFVRDMTPGRGGSHGKRHEFVIVARQPDHPILRGLPHEWRHATDELYDRLRGPANNLEVLATAFSDPKTGGTGEDEPMLVTIRFGKGRVFHTTLGHNPRAMQGVGFQTTLARGTEWAATGKVTLAAPEASLLRKDEVTYRDPLAKQAEEASASKEAAWTPLFDGKTLAGWTQHDGTATYRVDGDMIVGTTTPGSPNSFLCTNKLYGDFELTFETKVDSRLNAGVQIRSAARKGNRNRVHGPQVEIATDGMAGFIYGEALGTGWLSKNRKDPVKNAAFKRDAWNSYRVIAKGNHIRTWINGIPIADLVDDTTNMKKGFIGLQVHAVGRRGPFEVRWRNIRLREL